MTRILTLQLDKETRRALEACAPAWGAAFEHDEHADTGLRRLESDSAAISLVVIGAVSDPIRIAQRANMASPGLPLVLLGPEQDCRDLAEALRFAPFVSAEVRCLPLKSTDALLEEIRTAVERARRRQRHERTLEALNRKLAEEQHRPARTAADVLGRLLDIAPIGVVLCDAEGRVRGINPRGVELVGAREPRVVGLPLWELFPPDEGDRLRRLVERFNGNVGSQPHELVTRGSGDAALQLEVTGARLGARTDDLHYLVLLQDVTERQRLIGELQRANQRKDEFLALLGHELRNPLAPIRTALELMELRSSGAERERRIIERQTDHLVGLVDDLLDVSRITRGRIELRKEPLETASFIAEAIEMAGPLIEQRHHELDVEVPRDGLPVHGDDARLTQVVTNLLTNAAKYTPPGGTIGVWARREGDEVVFGVRDNGNGIRAELLPEIFDPFSQEKQSIDRSRGGLGLGLAIVRSLVELHGGSVHASSELGKGSEFVVRLPALAASTTPAEAPQPSPPTGEQPAPDALRVLVVDDNEDAAIMMSELLRSKGLATAVAHDGPSALERAKAFRPQVAVLDIGLPVMSGYELARRIVELPGLEQLRLVAVTGYGGALDRAHSREAGFEEHLVKPISKDALLTAVERVVSPRDSGRGG